MARLTLRSLLGGGKGTAGLAGSLLASVGAPLAIEDTEGRLLAGDATAQSASRYPVALDSTTLGWVVGNGKAEAVAAVLSHLAGKEAEKKALGSEVLHLYREVNLIYNFSERLAAQLDVQAVAEMTLEQARQMIAATDGAVVLLDEETRLLEPVATFGRGVPCTGGIRWGEGIVGTIAASGNAEIVNDVRLDPRCEGEHPRMESLLCAPLKISERVSGAIALASSSAVTYTAGDLKLLNTLALQAAAAVENARLFEKTVQAARDRERLAALHKELELASSIQANLFPSEMPRLTGYDVAARNRPARQCGGDYYDALPLAPNGDGARVLLCVADVSGKGLAASLLMSNTQATLRALIGRTPSLADMAAQASELLYASTSANKYVTAALVELAVESGTVRYVSAGHTDCLHLTAAGEANWLKSTGTPLGLLPPGFPFDEHCLTLEPGDCLALFSDGVPEAQNEAGDEFGEARLAEVVRASSSQSAEAIVGRVFEAIDTFAGGAPQYDDITLMIIKKS